MPRAATWVFLVTASVPAFAQGTMSWPFGSALASPAWPFGPPHSRVNLEGLLAHADSETLSIELSDRRVIRFRLNGRTRYRTDGASANLSAFHVADVVGVESDVDDKGYLEARSVRFVRKPSPDEQSEIQQSPEILQRWRQNVLGDSPLDQAKDDRRLSLVAKPAAIPDRRESETLHSGKAATAVDDLIPLIRTRVQEAFESLPSFRAKQVTSMFHSSSKPVKWIPDGVVAAEIGYEENREFYSDIRIDGKRPGNASETVGSDYMRSLDKAWSTGDFETISHCLFSELEDSDFRRTAVERGSEGDVVAYEFAGRRSSACIALKFRSEIAYPAYKGLMKVHARTHELLHVELEATDLPAAFPLDRAERSVDLATVSIGTSEYRLPVTGYWFGCFRNSYSCFLNRMDFRDYRRFEADSTVRFRN
jgi:hypothetical protein